jgi:hypothetical protein
MDVFGNDISCNPMGTNTLGDLAKLCQATSGCVAFNVWQPPGGVLNYCLKTSRSATVDLSTSSMKGACLGTYTGGLGGGRPLPHVACEQLACLT